MIVTSRSLDKSPGTWKSIKQPALYRLVVVKWSQGRCELSVTHGGVQLCPDEGKRSRNPGLESVPFPDANQPFGLTLVWIISQCLIYLVITVSLS